MKLIVGLGNPGPQYVFTRHNLGFMVLDILARRFKLSFDESKKFSGQLAVLPHAEHEKVFFLKPQTFMNLSGQSVSACTNFYKIPPEDILVIHDDLDLAFAKSRFARGGRSAGHNGVESIIEQLGTVDFPRLKLGIGKPPFPDQEASDFVLQDFSKDELIVVRDLIERMADAVQTYLDEGLQKAMEEYN
jgi:PTH1 family peptidyl-tRNA hydrolase